MSIRRKRSAGESGSGKTTLGRAILGLNTPSSGHVLFGGQDISKGDAAARQNLHRNLQMVFQNPYSSLNPRMTVAQTIGEALHFHKVVPPHDIPAEISRLLGLVGLTADMAGRYTETGCGIFVDGPEVTVTQDFR